MKFKEFFLEKWYDTRGEPRDEQSDLGYFDADDLIGKRVWIHTNRSNAQQNRNGMIGVYYPEESRKIQKRSDNQRYGYTNDIRIVNCVFDVNKNCVERIRKGEKRLLCSGVLGTIVNTEGSDSSFQEFEFNPMLPERYNIFFLKNDPERKELKGADEVHMYATESGQFIKLLRNPTFVD